ncbi:hypothetical protein [Paenibacillus sp. FSL R5-0810]|uniref:hypothetical protein n=1 Tax=Paenibacillus sp. FSL R5-0810 TaxID=2921659 RepID=UPI0030FADED2
MSKLIQNDEQYNKALSGLVTMAAQLDDPLSSMSPEERDRKQAIYDRTAELIQYYRRGQMVRKFPGLREQYESLGWKWQELSVPVQSEPDQMENQPGEKAVPEEPDTQPPAEERKEPKNAPPAKPAPNKSLMDWLDD